MRRSTEISALKVREAKAWKVIDQHLRLDLESVPAKVRQAAAEFVLKRLYPETHIFGGNGPNGEFKVVVEIADENYSSQEAGNRVSQYIQI